MNRVMDVKCTLGCSSPASALNKQKNAFLSPFHIPSVTVLSLLFSSLRPQEREEGVGGGRVRVRVGEGGSPDAGVAPSVRMSGGWV